MMDRHDRELFERSIRHTLTTPATPGDGDLDHRAWVHALVGEGFTGAAAVETFPDHPFEQACRVGYATLAAAMLADGARPQHEIVVTSVPERFNEVAEILFGERVPEVTEVDIWEAK